MTVDKTNSREDKLRREYDLVVIGGGFHGVCAFEEAAARNISVLLLERDDFCSGASANSLKTVHGGIRYLQSGDIPRLRFMARARQLWALRAPRLIRPLTCIAPLPRSFVASAPVVRIGALGYRLLTLDLRATPSDELVLESPRVIAKDAYRKMASPFLDDKTRHGLQWQDYQAVDSERLVIESVLAGERGGGAAVNYADVQAINSSNASTVSIHVRDRMSAQDFLINARSAIAFTGSAPGDTALTANSEAKRSWPVLAVNLVVNRRLAECGVAFGAGKTTNRYLFCVPWQEGSIVGTWYKRAPDMNINGISPHQMIDLEELLRDVNDSLVGTEIMDSDITRIHWGWLPGDRTGLGDAENSLLKDPLVMPGAHSAPAPKCIFVEGTKFTGANIVAANVLDELGSRAAKPKDSGRLPTSPILGRAQHSELSDQARTLGLPGETVDRLAQQYGNAAFEILSICQQRPELAQPIHAWRASVLAEIVYCAQEEQAMNLSDVIFRRTGIGARGIPALETLRCCAMVMGASRGWNDGQIDEQVQLITSQPFDGRWVNQ